MVTGRVGSGQKSLFSNGSRVTGHGSTRVGVRPAASLAHANGLLNLANHSFWDLVIPDGFILELLGDLDESVLKREDVTEGAEVRKG